MPKRKYKRKKKLIKPKFQLKVAVACLGVATFAVITLMILINEAILDFAEEGFVDSAALQDRWMGTLMGKLGLALCVLAPITLALGVLLMHRVAGPLYRFEVFLRQVVRGEHPGECRIRKGDELQDLCDTLNQLTAPLRDGRVDCTLFAESMGEPLLPTPTAEDEAKAESLEREQAA